MTKQKLRKANRREERLYSCTYGWDSDVDQGAPTWEKRHCRNKPVVLVWDGTGAARCAKHAPAKATKRGKAKP